MTTIYVSPGVYTKEIDISNIIPNLATSSAAVVVDSIKGDILQPHLISNNQQLLDEYCVDSIPASGNLSLQSALAFLKWGKVLWVQRAVKAAKYGGVAIMKSTSGDANAALGAMDEAKFNTPLSDDLIQVYAKDPGVWDNRVGIRIVRTTAGDADYTFDIQVYYQDTNGTYQLVETWTVSRKTKLDGYGRQLYLETRVNGFSNYIVAYNNTAELDTVLPKAQVTTLAITAGANGSAVTSAEINTSWDKFANPEETDIRMLINAGFTDQAVQLKMQTIAESRKDCIAILDMPYASLASAAAMVAWRIGVTCNINSSYCALYSGWGKIYDQYNDALIDIPPSGLVAAQYAYNDYAANFWYAPAGFNRGVLGVLGLTNKFTEGERDTLYQAQINPLQVFIGRGNVIWGQKTLQTKASALDRVNVRRLLIVLEKAMAAAMQYFVFEPNNDSTRFRVFAQCTSYLDQLYSQGAFQSELGDKGYTVICDATNNTPDVIARHELHVDIFVKPSMAAEFIVLSVIVTATGASFNELISRGVNL